MTSPAHDIGDRVLLGEDSLDALVRLLAADHRVVGPRVGDGAIVIGDLASAADLPRGWLDQQEAGRYRLEPDAVAGPFDHVVGPFSLKNFLFPARETLSILERVDGSWVTRTPAWADRPLAVIGVRGCDLAALAIQDRVFLGNGHVDPLYAARRERLFLVAVDCRRPAPTCFCHSTGTGPAACDAATGRGADLILTDLGPGPEESAAATLGIPADAPRIYACRIGSAAGAGVIARLLAEDPEIGAPSPEQESLAEAIPLATARHLAVRDALPTPGRRMAMEGLRDLLYANLDHPRFEEVATRCLSCTNCTLVCPTCFCASVSEVPELDAERVSRERRWESCFSLDHARMHGHSVRHSTASRYRQWLTHKLGGWIDQFGVSGCTGCGRCITWCPVGIDLTEEVAAIRSSTGDGSPVTADDAPGRDGP